VSIIEAVMVAVPRRFAIGTSYLRGCEWLKYRGVKCSVTQTVDS
jgi:hypothetical protein